MVKTSIPLAIYVPPDTWQPSQTGRFQWRIANRVAKHPGIAIDSHVEHVRLAVGIRAGRAEIRRAESFTRRNDVPHELPPPCVCKANVEEAGSRNLDSVDMGIEGDFLCLN